MQPEQESTKNGNHVTRGNRFDRPGNSRNGELGSNFSGEKSGGTVSELIAFGGEKRWGETSSDQSESIKQSGPRCILQDERSVFFLRNATTRELYVKDRIERHILCSSIIKKITEICQVLMESFYVYASDFLQCQEFLLN